MAQVEFPSNPYHGQVYREPSLAASYIYDRTRDSWYFEPLGAASSGDGGGGGSNVIISDLAPAGQPDGTLWIESNTYFLYVWDENATPNGGRWVGITNNGGDNSAVHMSIAPPQNSQSGSMWFDTESGDLRVLFSDDTSSQWVTITSNGQSLGVTSNIIRILEQEIEQLSDEVEDLKNQLDQSQASSVITLE